MMTYLPSILFLTILVVSILLCKTRLRDEDKSMVADHTLYVCGARWPKSLLLGYLIACIIFAKLGNNWFTWFCFLLFIMHHLLYFLPNYSHRYDYYAYDDEVLFRVEKDNVVWAIKWNDVNKLCRRVVNNSWNRYNVVYDIYTKHGRVYCDLPVDILGVISKHTDVEIEV